MRETTTKIVFSEPATSAQICHFFCVFFLWRGFGKSDKFGFFRRWFSSGAENTIKTVVSGTRSHEKRGHVSFSTFLLVFFDRFRASLVSTLLPGFWRFSCRIFTENLFLGVLGKRASFEAFLVDVPTTPIKRVQKRNRLSRFQPSCAWNPYKTSEKEETAAEETHANKPEGMRKKQTPRGSISRPQIRRRLRRRGRRRRIRRRRRRRRRKNRRRRRRRRRRRGMWRIWRTNN